MIKKKQLDKPYGRQTWQVAASSIGPLLKTSNHPLQKFLSFDTFFFYSNNVSFILLRATVRLPLLVRD